jgi:hypothetical protein
MAARANWKVVLKIGEVSCRVALYTASTPNASPFTSSTARPAIACTASSSGERVETKERKGVRDQRRRLCRLRWISALVAPVPPESMPARHTIDPFRVCRSDF